MGKLDGKIALVTGSSRGIGKEIAILFAKEGADVIITSKNSVREGLDVVKEIRDLGRNSIYIQADLSSNNGVEFLFNKIGDFFDKIDILVNNCGVTIDVDVDKISEETLKNDFNNNFIPTVLCTNKVLKYMKKGKIINTSSIRGIDYSGRPNIIGYCASKAAINSFTKNMALYLAPDIQINAVAPGMTETDTLIKNSEQMFSNWIDNTPLKKLISPKELADIYLFLACSDIFTGSVITVDAGYTILGR